MLRVVLLAALLFPGFVLGQSASKQEQIFDNEIMPLVDLLAQDGRSPNPAEIEALTDMVHRFNSFNRTKSEKEVVRLDMNLYTWRTRLNDLVPETAAIAFCAESIGGLKACEEAGAYLRHMTAQCSGTVLGVIDLDEEGDVPLDLFQDEFPDLGDPNFIMLKRRNEDMRQLSPVRVRGDANPDTVAIVLCPEESKAFGHVLRP